MTLTTLTHPPENNRRHWPYSHPPENNPLGLSFQCNFQRLTLEKYLKRKNSFALLLWWLKIRPEFPFKWAAHSEIQEAQVQQTPAQSARSTLYGFATTSPVTPEDVPITSSVTPEDVCTLCPEYPNSTYPLELWWGLKSQMKSTFYRNQNIKTWLLLLTVLLWSWKYTAFIINNRTVSTIEKEQQWDTTLHPLGWPLSKKQNKTENNKCQQRCGETGTPVHCWWECEMV